MVPLAGLSRRAFVAASALTALAPTAAAARRRKPAPEVFVAIAIQGVTVTTNVNGTFFLWSSQNQIHHPASGFTKDLSGTTTTTAINGSQEQTRQTLISGAQFQARTVLSQAGHDVPTDRIAVVVL